MTGSLDPWRTLGLTPGSSLDEIRRAYRRLAKVNHPDAAGESALPRFLAIQAAYEVLAAPKPGRRPGSRPGSSPSNEAWRADRDRARASGAATGPRRPPPGSRPSGTRGAGAPDGTASNGGSAADQGAAGGRATGAGASGARAKPGGPGEAGSSRRAGAGRRPANRATPGSTSYDAADEEPFEPGWSGATWYGTSSGTYWTINPKEYADPRKHGPEYQRRARRSASGGWVLDDEDAAPPSAAQPEAPDERERNGPEPAGRRPSRPTHEQNTEPTRPAAAAGAATPGETRGRSAADPGRTRPVPPPRPSWTSTARGPGDKAPKADPPPPGPDGGPPRAPGLAGDGIAAPLLRPPTTPAGRLGLALLGWPPLGVVCSTVIGESTGCGRFSASCSEVFSPGTWIVQVAIILLLLALPRVAGWSAVGTLFALAAAVPTAVLLSAGGGSRQPDASATLLLGVLGVAYVAGVVWAIARRWWPSAVGRRVP
jgi:hypothetical protein